LFSSYIRARTAQTDRRTDGRTDGQMKCVLRTTSLIAQQNTAADSNSKRQTVSSERTRQMAESHRAECIRQPRQRRRPPWRHNYAHVNHTHSPDGV